MKYPKLVVIFVTESTERELIAAQAPGPFSFTRIKEETKDLYDAEMLRIWRNATVSILINPNILTPKGILFHEDIVALARRSMIESGFDSVIVLTTGFLAPRWLLDADTVLVRDGQTLHVAKNGPQASLSGAIAGY